MNKAKVSFVKFENNDVIATSGGVTAFFKMDSVLGNTMSTPSGFEYTANGVWKNSQTGAFFSWKLNGGDMADDVYYILNSNKTVASDSYNSPTPGSLIKSFTGVDTQSDCPTGITELTTYQAVCDWLYANLCQR